MPDDDRRRALAGGFPPAAGPAPTGCFWSSSSSRPPASWGCSLY
jgi:hypothetical protein